MKNILPLVKEIHSGYYWPKINYVFREGEFGQTAYIIETGTIELVKYLKSIDSFLFKKYI